MVAVATVAGKFTQHLLKGDIDTDVDTWKASLHTSAASGTLVKDTTDFFNVVTSELATAGGYTAGGLALTVIAPTYTAANSFAVVRAVTTVYAFGDVVRPAVTNGFLYRATTAGTSSATAAPVYPTIVGQTLVDGTVTWTCIGTAIMALDISPDPTWTTATFTCRYMVIRKDTGTSSTSPVIGWVDFGADQSPVAVNFTVIIHTAGLLLIPV